MDEPDVREIPAEEEHHDVDGNGTSSLCKLDDEDSRSPTLGTAERIPGWRAPSYSRTAHHAASRIHSLPPAHLTRSSKLLNTLSPGQLLCVTYNIGVRQSRKP